jgi:TonB family protein
LRAVRAPRRTAPLPSHATLPDTAPITVVDVARTLASRPAVRFFGVAVVAAVGLHAAAGSAGLGIRPSVKARGENVVAATVVEPVDAIPEDMPAPPPPPPPPPPTRSSTTAPPDAAPRSAPTASAVALAAPPLVSGVAGGAAGFSFAGGGGDAGAPLASTRPTATATAAPTVTAARPLRRQAPTFPAQARRAGQTGVVVLQIHVDEAGNVVDVRVVQSDPPGVFDAAAVDSVRGWTFSPGTSDGHPVASWVRQTIRFTLEDT